MQRHDLTFEANNFQIVLNIHFSVQIFQCQSKYQSSNIITFDLFNLKIHKQNKMLEKIPRIRCKCNYLTSMENSRKFSLHIEIDFERKKSLGIVTQKRQDFPHIFSSTRMVI